MVFKHITGFEADQQKHILRDIPYAKRHKDLQELHEYCEKMCKGAEDAVQKAMERVRAMAAMIVSH